MDEEYIDDFISQELGLEINFVTFKTDLTKLISQLKQNVKHTKEVDNIFKKIDNLLDWYC